MPTSKDTDESDSKSTGQEAVIKNDRIAVLTSEAVTEVAGSPRRRSARLCASPAPEYVPVPVKRRRSTSSTSSMADDTKVVVQRISIRKNDLPDSIEEEVVDAAKEEDKPETSKVGRTRRTSQIFDASQEREATPARVTRSRRSSQNFEGLKEESLPASPARLTRSRRSSQSFEPLKEVDETEAAAGKRTRAKKPDAETIEEVDEAAEVKEKAGSDEEKREELAAVSKSLEKIVADRSDDGHKLGAVHSKVDVEMEDENAQDDLSDAKQIDKTPTEIVTEAQQKKDSGVSKDVVEETSAEIAAKISPTKEQVSTNDVRSINDEEVIDVVTVDDKSPVKKVETPKKVTESPKKSTGTIIEQSADAELKIETPKKSESPTKKVENSATKSMEVDTETDAERVEAVAEVAEPEKSSGELQAAELKSEKKKSEDKENKSSGDDTERPKGEKPITKHSENMKLGRRVSGRFWKSERDRFRSTIKSKGLKLNFKQRMEQKEAMNRAKELERQLKEEKQREREELRARQEANKKKREENARKTEIVQVIKNPAKIKRMKKKQLRMLEKRDTTVVHKK